MNEEKRTVLVIGSEPETLRVMRALMLVPSGRPVAGVIVDIARLPDITDVTEEDLANDLKKLKAEVERQRGQPYLIPFRDTWLARLVRRSRETRAFVRDLRRMHRGSRGWRRHVRDRKARGTWRR